MSTKWKSFVHDEFRNVSASMGLSNNAARNPFWKLFRFAFSMAFGLCHPMDYFTENIYKIENWINYCKQVYSVIVTEYWVLQPIFLSLSLCRILLFDINSFTISFRDAHSTPKKHQQQIFKAITWCKWWKDEQQKETTSATTKNGRTRNERRLLLKE